MTNSPGPEGLQKSIDDLQRRKLNPGSVEGFLEIELFAHPAPVMNYYNLKGSSIAIIGKNGSGKSTILKKMADTVFSELKFQKYGDRDKYWSGGFVLSPTREETITGSSSLWNIKSYSNDEEIELAQDQVLLQKIVRDPKWWATINSAERDRLLWENYAVFFNFHRIFPQKLKLTRALREYNLAPKFDSRVSLEIASQNSFILMMHPFPTIDDEYFDIPSFEPKPLVSRVVSSSPDYPFIHELRNQIFSLYDFLSKSEHADIDQLAELIAYGKDGEVESLDGNILFTPFILPWYLLNVYSDDLQETFLELKNSFPSRLIEWPQTQFQIPPSSKLLLCAVDVHLKNEEFHQNLTDHEQLSLATNSDYLKVHSSLSTEFMLQVADILKAWEVVPEWVQTFEHQNQVHTTQKGHFYSFREGKLFLDNLTSLNESTKRWVFRAIQCADLLNYAESFDSYSTVPYRILIWDEPELGLHPTAVLNISNKVLPWTKAHGMKVIFATHSAVLGSTAESLFLCQRQTEFPGQPYLSEISNLSFDTLETAGITKTDLLVTFRNFLILEGEHDRAVFETLFKDEFERCRTKVLTISGTHNLLTLPESEILFSYLNSKIIIVVDGKRRASLTEHDQDYLQQLNDACAEKDYTQVRSTIKKLKMLMKKRKVADDSELGKLLEVVERWTSLTVKNGGDLSRVRIRMLHEGDIMHYLDPSTVLGRQVGLDWRDLRKAFQMRNDKSLREKDFYRKEFNARISVESIKKAAKKKLDSELPIELTKVIELLD